MRKVLFRPLIMIVLLVSPLLVACEDGLFNGNDEPISAAIDTVKNLPSDPPVRIGPTGPVGTGKFTLYSFETKSIVPNTDSATTKWDIGFRATSIVFNSGVSGPGTVAAQLVEGIFTQLPSAPEQGYRQDASGAPVISPVSGQGWYTYTGPNGIPANVLLPTPGRVIVLRTNKNTYVKMEILSYYKDHPPVQTLTQNSPSRYLTFRYVHQTNGSRVF